MEFVQHVPLANTRLEEQQLVLRVLLLIAQLAQQTDYSVRLAHKTLDSIMEPVHHVLKAKLQLVVSQCALHVRVQTVQLAMQILLYAQLALSALVSTMDYVMPAINLNIL